MIKIHIAKRVNIFDIQAVDFSLGPQQKKELHKACIQPANQHVPIQITALKKYD
jgi:hypothetical protein